MTKPRVPISFGQAIARIAGVIGWDEAGLLCGRAGRTARLWSETDKTASPTLEQAIALDSAYLAAGGLGAPILECYALKVDVQLADSLACRIALTEDIGTLARESGEAISFALLAARPGSTPKDMHRALGEAEEAVSLHHRIMARIKGLLAGNGASQ